jgi:hypothetical protein
MGPKALSFLATLFVALCGIFLLKLQAQSGAPDADFEICYSLDDCRSTKEFTLLLDRSADYTLHSHADATVPQFDVNFVIFSRPSDGLVYRMPNLVRTSTLFTACQLKGSPRPFLQCNGSHGLYDGFHVNAANIAQPSDAELVDMLRQLNDPSAPEDLKPRLTFYIGQAFEQKGDYEKAVKYYRQRVELGGWRPETFYAQFRVGYGLLALNKTEEAKMELLKANALDPSRKEPLYYLGRLARVENDFPLCMLYTGAAMQLGQAWTDALFVDSDIYLWRVEDERALCLYYVGRKVDAQFHWNRLRQMDAVPPKEKERIVENLKK